MSNTNRIDVHHHFVPPKYAAAVKKSEFKGWPSPEWSVEASQKLGEDLGIKTAILSLTAPGVDIVGPILEDQLAIAVDANDAAAKIRDSNTSQFGFFASIPNPVEFLSEAITELSRAFDDLHADGITLLTNYSGKYLGHADFQPLWTELNRRKAVVFIHPTTPPGFVPVNKFLIAPMLDFTFETTKTATDLILSSTTINNPDLKIILSHAGGTLPFVWNRVASLGTSFVMTDLTQDTFLDQASSFYFDTALTGWGDNIELLFKFAKKGHVLYGSDFPYAPNSCIEDMTKGLDSVLEKDGNEDVRKSVNWANALELFPRLKKAFE